MSTPPPLPRPRSRAKERDLTTGPIAGHVRALAIPSALSLLFITLYNVTDTAYAGQLSTQAQAGLGLGAQLFFAVSALGIGFRIGASSVVGQLVGERDAEGVRQASAQVLLLSIVTSAVVMAIGPFFFAPLVDWVAQGDAYGEDAKSYIRLLLISTPGYVIGIALSGVLQAVGDVITLARAQAAASLANIGLNPLFVWGVPGVIGGLGLDGIAVATIVCQLGMLVYTSWVCWGSSCYADFRLSRMLPDWPVLGDLMRQILPGTTRLLVITVGGFIAQLWLRADGESAVAAYNVGLRLEQLLLLPAIGITAALLPLTSQNIGAGRPDRVRAGFWWGVGLSSILLFAGSGTIWLVGDVIASWFGAGPEAEAMALDYLHVESFVFPLFALLFGLQNLLQGLKRPFWPMVVGLWRQGLAVLVFGWIYVELLDMGSYGVWLTVASGVVTGLLFMMVVAWRVLPEEGLSLWGKSER